ncbi:MULTISPECIES: protein--protein lipoyl transferase [unclassified Streptococcus]|uniref:lipoate--protein ligase family protein n=1 Tax=unclassified Streptococcus TaxID=2608887 RepID=UPI0010720C2D|nr:MULTISPECIES: protein--protein lipoyl transferase [unclassified Streptococcus]MBF0787351.1 protein--protein lipoyl transferase [Streptococcus sp. 19428wC2_LYSM12]MCQ9211111.1 protein--protein lipoyl transferase [Streptococcus sp. B01]MCQ9214386.1 protein--protein lipoyl transferase [Streptococcus sp. O1]TFV05697.1 protein--protein lipoyl transferase [Streptococcus sp. LYSM12]
MLQTLADFRHTIYQSSEGVIGSSLDELVLADVFLKEVNRNQEQIIWHIWPLEQTVILGMADCRLPYLARGLEVIRKQGYTPLVRSIGGLAVVADAGIVNLSLIIPERLGADKVDMGQAYHLMVTCIKELLSLEDSEVEVGEISDSYCPGSYDLSIKGKKFAGLAQRRIKSGIAISAYISLSGHQAKRGELIRDFYQAAIGEDAAFLTYPRVNPASMATLSDLLDQSVGLEDIVAGIRRFIMRIGHIPANCALSMESLADFAKGKKEAMEHHQKVGLG